jgi:hypothetical protein
MPSGSPHGPGALLPIVVVPVGVDEAVLDACLGALERTTPPATRVWLADDARGGPRVRAVVDAWLADTRMQAEYGRRPRSLGEAAHLGEVLASCGDADVAVLACDAQPAPGWLSRLARCLTEHPDAVTLTPWCNAGETAAWPRLGEAAPLPQDPARIADAASAEAGVEVLPAAVDHAVLIRGHARRAAGGIDAASFGSWYAALIDLSLRMQALGGRNLLCTRAYVARTAEGRPADGDLDRLAARWPHWRPALARFLMDDPLRVARERLLQAVQAREAGAARQPRLFGDAAA